MRAAIASLLVALAISNLACAESSPEPQSVVSGAGQSQPEQPTETAQPAQPASATAEQQNRQAGQSQSEQQAVQANPRQLASQGQSERSQQPSLAAQQSQADSAAASQEQADAGQTVPEGTRIVSLFGDVTEILYALGVEDYIVGVDVSSVFPEAAQGLPDVGFAGALSVEGVLALNPSIVIGGSIVAPGPPGAVEQLEQAGVNVLILPELVGLDSPGVKIRAVGAALGIPERAEALAQRVESEIAAAGPGPDVDTEPLSVLFVYLRRGGIQLVSGAGREAETIITAAGGVDAGAAAGIEGWQPLSPEALLAIDPDIYLVMELGYDAVGGLDGLLDIPGMSETAAGRHQRVIVMEDILLLGFGPRMAESIVQLRDYMAEVRQSLQDASTTDR
ncbi:MAG: ABC transporter substrate-binding protein [Chloroflexi bacterium]|nr:ABC transporter substrate-binding protein [Chloroflexota bacterium]MCY3696304.1 ABC transporter substrate-binding protein [Chloroflexota bacterium]